MCAIQQLEMYVSISSDTASSPKRTFQWPLSWCGISCLPWGEFNAKYHWVTSYEPSCTFQFHMRFHVHQNARFNEQLGGVHITPTQTSPIIDGALFDGCPQVVNHSWTLLDLYQMNLYYVSVTFKLIASQHQLSNSLSAFRLQSSLMNIRNKFCWVLLDLIG